MIANQYPPFCRNLCILLVTAILLITAKRSEAVLSVAFENVGGTTWEMTFSYVGSPANGTYSSAAASLGVNGIAFGTRQGEYGLRTGSVVSSSLTLNGASVTIGSFPGIIIDNFGSTATAVLGLGSFGSFSFNGGSITISITESQPAFNTVAGAFAALPSTAENARPISPGLGSYSGVDSGIFAVPEPSSGLLWLGSIAMLLLRRTRQHH